MVSDAIHIYFTTEFMERVTWIVFKVKESLQFFQEIIHDAFKKRMCAGDLVQTIAWAFMYRFMLVPLYGLASLLLWF